jgi:putative phosphoesterase
MVKILAFGDSHIPRRAKYIPEKVFEKIDEITRESLIDYTLFTGDLIKAPDLVDYLKLKTKRDFFIVQGNMDHYGGNKDAPYYQKLVLSSSNGEKLTVGLTHGAQIEPRGDHSQLEYLALENHYNILISGHTHKEEVYLTEKGILLLNPGSSTGAWSFVASQMPSFLIISLDEGFQKIEINLYQLINRSGVMNKSSFFYFFHNNKIKRK